jgi:hypothetical protein
VIEQLKREIEKKEAHIRGLTLVVWGLCAALCLVLALALVGGGG